jgi:glycosyltransferase involved in cell wall biosynthesis
VIFTPDRTAFVLLSFEGPDLYSQAGGLGVRMKGLSRSLATLGYDTHLYFVGDPDLPGKETQEGGKLHYRRWCQWISAQHRGGVYDGEEGKIRDWNSSLPAGVIEEVIVPAAAAGKSIVLLGEEWHTSWSMSLISDNLYRRGLRDRVVMLWNANNTFGFNRIDWPALTLATTVTTVSRYMKFMMWNSGQNPVVIPNGIPRSAIADADPAAVTALRVAADADHLCFKIGRFDPDKRWLMAVSAMAYLKRRGQRVTLLMRGGHEAHGGEVIDHARQQGLVVVDAPAPADPLGLASLLRQNQEADVINFTTFVSDPIVMLIHAACDAVLANSGHEPFGLVGLEVMAAGGLAVTGSTGEDYAEAYRNALVLETSDPVELVTGLALLKERPKLAQSMRRRGRTTARAYVWEKVIDELLLRTEFAAAQQAVRPPPTQPRPSVKPASNPSREPGVAHG